MSPQKNEHYKDTLVGMVRYKVGTC